MTNARSSGSLHRQVRRMLVQCITIVLLLAMSVCLGIELHQEVRTRDQLLSNAAQMAANELHGEYPERRIEVIDSRGASLGEGMIVLEAAKMLRSGADLDEVTARVKELIPNMCQCFTVDDLNYLKRSGRISGAAALIGGILGIRPLLIGGDEGRIVMYDKIRGAKRALDALAERYARLVTDKAREIGIAHADNEGGVAYLLGKLREHGFCGKELTVCYEPVTGAHVGPGTVALFFYGKRRVL